MKIELDNLNTYNSIYNKHLYSHSLERNIHFKSDYKIGSNIKNIGLVTQRIPLLNKTSNTIENCYLLYKKTNKGGVFSLYKNNIDKIKELSENLEKYPILQEVLNKYNFYTIPQVLEKIKTIDYKTAQLYEDLRIAECGYLIINNPKEKEYLIAKGYKPRNKEQEFIFIEDYFYDKTKGYDTSGKITAAPLFKKLIDSKKENILAIALAIGENAYSPANLYFRYGFKPFGKTEKDIEAQIIKTPKGQRINPKFTIPVYLPKDAKIYEILKKYNGLDEIDKIHANWL